VDVDTDLRWTGLNRKPDGLSTVKVLRFKYLGKEPGRNIETLPFYLRTIRGFLWKHKGDVVWLKGGIIEQPAYLVFKSELTNEVKEMLSQELREGGSFIIEPAEKPMDVLRKYAHNLRVTVGWLKLPNMELGAPETVPAPSEIEEIVQKVREGFMLTEYWFIKADDVEIKGEWAILKNVTEIGIGEGNRINYVRRQDKMGLRVKDLKFHPTKR
jgi:hypothetical protein